MWLLVATAAAAPPSLSLAGTDTEIGGAVHATAELADAPDASGEITFEVFAADDPTCSEPASSQTSVAVSGEGEYVSPDFVPPLAGTYRWSAHYSGDGTNEPSDSVCSATSTVSKASPGLTGAASSGAVGTPINDEASITGGFSPSGEVTFSVFGPGDTTCSTALATSTVPLSAGQAASANFVPQETGEFRWTASYSGDANNEAATLGCNAGEQASTVSKVAPGLVGTATPSVTVGATITDSVTLSGGFSPGGEIVFRAFGPGDATCSGAAAYEATVAVSGNGSYAPLGFAPGPGTYRWTASYSGDANNEAASLGCNTANQTSTVGKAAPGLVGTATSAVVVGATITDSVTLSGGFSPGGEIVFRAFGPDDASCAGAPAYEATATVDGNGNYSPAGFAPAPGSYRWTASYSGDADNEPVALGCNAADQTSTVSRATPGLTGAATSFVSVGGTITDSVTLSGGFSPGGEIVFRAFGPGDATCSGAPAYEKSVAVSGNGAYSPPGFAPGPGLYRWTASYGGDAGNEAAALACNVSEGQSSAVGILDVKLSGSANDGTVGEPIKATATIAEGASPGGQLTLRAFSPGDANCSGVAAFSSDVKVAGNAIYSSAPFVPGKVGTFRWTVTYSGDAHHAQATVACGQATSKIGQATPSIAGTVPQSVVLGTPFQDTATLKGGYAPGGRITFRIYGPVGSGCAKPSYVNTVAVTGNGTFSSAPFVAQRPGRYSFAASYSGDAANQAAAEPCDSAAQVVIVRKRSPKVKPRAALVGARKIAVRARLSGGAAPAGAITFRLFGPGDKHCKRNPTFSGAIKVKSNGTFSLARYLATRPGLYRLSVGYSGDPRNKRLKPSCGGAQSIRVS